MSTQDGSQTAADPTPSQTTIHKPNPALLEHARERAKSGRTGSRTGSLGSQARCASSTYTSSGSAAGSDSA